MTGELERTEEQAERRSAFDADMMRSMCTHHLLEVPPTQEEAHGQPAVDESVVDDPIRHAEERHSDSDTVSELPRDSRCTDATMEHEDDCDRRVEDAQRIVPFESTDARDVVRPMNEPQPRMPDLAVKESRPKLHQERHDERHREPNQKALTDAHDALSRGRR